MDGGRSRLQIRSLWHGCSRAVQSLVLRVFAGFAGWRQQPLSITLACSMAARVQYKVLRVFAAVAATNNVRLDYSDSRAARSRGLERHRGRSRFQSRTPAAWLLASPQSLGLRGIHRRASTPGKIQSTWWPMVKFLPGATRKRTDWVFIGIQGTLPSTPGQAIGLPARPGGSRGHVSAKGGATCPQEGT